MKNRNEIRYEEWLRLLLDLYYHSTDECKKELYDGKLTDVEGCEHVRKMVDMPRDILKEVIDSPLSSLKMTKYVESIE